MPPSVISSFKFATQPQQNVSSSPETQNGNGYSNFDHLHGRNYTTMQDQMQNDNVPLHSPNNNHPVNLQKYHVQKPQKAFLTLLPPTYPSMAVPSIDTVSTGISQPYSDSRDHYEAQRDHSDGGWHPTHAQPPPHLHMQMHSAPPTAHNSLETFQNRASRFHHSTVPPVTAPLTLPHEYTTFGYSETPFQSMHPSDLGPLQHQQSQSPAQHSTQSNPTFEPQLQAPYFVALSATAPYLPSSRPGMHLAHSFSGSQGEGMYSPATMDGGQTCYFQQSDAKSDQGGTLATDPSHQQQQKFGVEQQEQNHPTSWLEFTAMNSTTSEVAPEMLYPAVYESAGLADTVLEGYSGKETARLQTGTKKEGMDAPCQSEITNVDQSDTQSSRRGPANHSEENTSRRSLRRRGNPEHQGSPASLASNESTNGNKGHIDFKMKRQGTTEVENPRKKSKKRRAADEPEEASGVRTSGKGNQFILTLYGMVESTSSYPLIGWNLPGTAIVIPDSKAFATSLLNKYYRHSTISSFARQLVSYGFMKTELPARQKALVNNSVRTDSRHWTFSHDSFLRGRADLLDRVVPTPSPNRVSLPLPFDADNTFNESVLSVIQQLQPPGKRSLAALKREEEAYVEVLKRENTQWRERCTRIEHALMEEKARAYQYYILLAERGIIPGNTREFISVPLAFKVLANTE
ncbi:hypothetical protein QFC19_008677 [Naganishia cerealis]|uniref:Uncharacterized protein n=1 Tax=Naganishia cerealis TaxID=610337 RepID=A0ACC2V0V8_9TREE|nr:hypothetical protein QFC19_008677 [Naganishia cerealis]